MQGGDESVSAAVASAAAQAAAVMQSVGMVPVQQKGQPHQRYPSLRLVLYQAQPIHEQCPFWPKALIVSELCIGIYLTEAAYQDWPKRFVSLFLALASQ